MKFVDIGIIVVEKAMEIFEICGAENDYCVQYIGVKCVIFGGTNRVIFDPMDGFSLDKKYCTEKFKTNFEKYFRL